MESMKLSDISNALNGRYIDDCTFSSVCIDTRKIEKGCLYIAIKGENFDGHTFLDKAFELGAAACVSQYEYSSPHTLLVGDTRQALLDLAGFYRNKFNIDLVAVTGSVGKTSTKEMIYAVLSSEYKTLKTEGNHNNEIGLPLTLLGLDNSYKTGVIEMGMSNLNEITKLSKCAKPNIGVITNIGVSHLETLLTRENILKAKLEICDGMSLDAPLILNADCDMLQNLNAILDRPIMYYGINNNADIMAKNIVINNFTTSFQIVYYGKIIEAKIMAVGQHNVYNALAAFCVGLSLNIEPCNIVKGLAQYKNAPLRQSIEVGNITIIEDCYNASPDSMISAIDVLKNIPCDGKQIAVFGDMLELGSMSEAAHLEVGKMVARANIDMLFCYGECAIDIKRGAKLVGMNNVYHFLDIEELIECIQKQVQKGDAIIFKASRGMRLERAVESIRSLADE